MNLILAAMLTALGFAGLTGETNETGAAKGGKTKITSKNTYYDRREGYAYLSGRVLVEDENYQLHADSAYVFMSCSNDLHRIVALGHVVITNDTKRAYGDKASYYRNPGVVVLYAGDDGVAEVRDESPKGPQVVRGRKIKFWTDTEQVEVLEADLSAPSTGEVGELKTVGE